MKKRVFKHEDATASEEDGLMLPEIPPPSPDDGDKGDDKGDDKDEEVEKDVPRVTWLYCLLRPWLWCRRDDASTTVAREQRKQEKRKQEKKKGEGEEHKKSSEGTSVLQKKLNRLAVKIGYGGTIAAVLCFFLLVIRFGIEFGVHNRKWDHDQHWEELLHFAIIAITVLVVAVPEGLPLAVTIALAYSVQRMLKDNNLVRHLDACETMGNATTICSDKTGTLTLNRMTVVEAYLAGKVCKCGTDNSFMLHELPHKLLELLQHCIILNCSYSSRIDEVCVCHCMLLCVSLYLIVCVTICYGVCHYVSLCVTICYVVCLCVIVCHYICHCVSLYMSLCVSLHVSYHDILIIRS